MSRFTNRVSVLAGICLLTAPVALAQSSFDQGSFDQGSFGTNEQPSVQQPAPSLPAPAPDSFGGSFGDAGSTATAPGDGSFQDAGSFAPAPVPSPTPTPAPTPAVQIPGGADFPGGSFGDDQTGVTPTPPNPQDVVNPPIQPEPGPTVTPVTPPTPTGPTIDPQIAVLETRDFGVPPTQQLRNGQFHSQTPTSIPGGQLVTTQALASAISANTQMVIIDVLGGQYALPNAYAARDMSQGGSYHDHIQQRTGQFLHQITGGQKQVPIVIYCSDPMCWLSYNAALRAIAAGYTNVYWYRGGIAAWQQAGLPLRPGAY